MKKNQIIGTSILIAVAAIIVAAISKIIGIVLAIEIACGIIIGIGAISYGLHLIFDKGKEEEEDDLPLSELLIAKMRDHASNIKADFDLKWRVLEKDGYIQKKLIDLDSDHLENIIVTQSHISGKYKRTILEILKKRNSQIKP